MANNSPIYNVQAPSFDGENSKESEKYPDVKDIEDTRIKDDSSDDEGLDRRSSTERRFNRSMRTVVKISKSYRSQVALSISVMKAKNRFLKLIDKPPQKIGDSEKEVKEICVSVVESEWQRLSQRPPIFKISNDIDFSDLAGYIIKTRRFTGGEATTERSAPGRPPPPPPSIAPPPPPTTPLRSPGGPKRGLKVKPIHVNRAHVKPNQETVWSTLPVIETELLSDLRKLFEDTSSSQEISRIQSISGPLSVAEASDVLIMFRQFPKYVINGRKEFKMSTNIIFCQGRCLVICAQVDGRRNNLPRELG